jgi:hypothetical protein
MAATKASAVSWPTPGMVISRRQASDERARRFMSRSIAVIASSTALCAASKPHLLPIDPATPSLPPMTCSAKAGLSPRGSRTPNTTARPRIWFSSVTRWPTSFLRARISARTAWAGSDFTRTVVKKPVRASCASPRASLRSVLCVASDFSAR